MKELEELTADIREKLPRLKELRKGCLIETTEKICEIDDLMYAVCDNDQIFDRFTDSWIFSDEYTIIGKDPMLNDILEWINEVTEDMVNINSEGVIYFTNYWNNPSDKVSNWDLSKPYLKDQSPELIKFLHGLIKK